MNCNDKCNDCIDKKDIIHWSPSLLGHKRGPAHGKRYSIKFNEHFEVIDIPADIPEDIVRKGVDIFLSKIVALEIPTSLICQLDCSYCYITDKWLKNKVVKVEEIERVTKRSFETILSYKKDQKKELAVSAWGAEPFYQIDTLEYMIDFCIDNKLKFNTSTNGNNNSDRVYRLLEKIFKNKLSKDIQVSLDGPKEIQDFNRPYAYDNRSSYDETIKFISFLYDLGKELKFERKPYHICATAYVDDNLTNSYLKSIEYFFNPDNYLVFSEVLPVRIENHMIYNKKMKNIFVDTMIKSNKLMEELSNKYNVPFVDYYTTKLFLETSRKDGFPYCSAMQTQLGIDLDGSIYMCHGPITTVKLKPYMCLGNIFSGILNYSAIISNYDMIHSWVMASAYCKTCDVFNTDGFLCFTCPPAGLALDGLPWQMDYYRCEAYRESLPIWKESFLRFNNFVNKNKGV